MRFHANRSIALVSEAVSKSKIKTSADRRIKLSDRDNMVFLICGTWFNRRIHLNSKFRQVSAYSSGPNNTAKSPISLPRVTYFNEDLIVNEQRRIICDGMLWRINICLCTV